MFLGARGNNYTVEVNRAFIGSLRNLSVADRNSVKDEKR